ncbi:hypothetical protein [Roseateles terrae]|uniref:Uncharacterized protein n=1 Tax=Roseateles terrae TaxID=431060 RepID=A0ABR6GXT6_9BURK|nr:hypothetical protein [Roseateles terrae]MBB3195928.1 hypothetical protein [Roseateles terrae]OWQ85581.1 hypothetical protein CDN98_16865 [Roseateles terrae]
MKAPLHLPGSLADAHPNAERRRAAARRLWRQRLTRAASIGLAVALVWAAMALLSEAEGDLRQVRATDLSSPVTANA